MVATECLQVKRLVTMLPGRSTVDYWVKQLQVVIRHGIECHIIEKMQSPGGNVVRC